MIRPMLSRLLLAAVPLLAGTAFAADEIKFEPYVIDHMARAGSPVDCRRSVFLTRSGLAVGLYGFTQAGYRK